MISAHTADEVEDGHKDANRIGITAQSDIAESNIVVRGDMTCRYTSQRSLLAQLDILHCFEGEGEVSEKDMYAQETDDAKIAKHAVEGESTVLSYNFAAFMTLVPSII